MRPGGWLVRDMSHLGSLPPSHFTPQVLGSEHLSMGDQTRPWGPAEVADCLPVGGGRCRHK